ncbi:DNA-binding response regulator, NarL/FixJ family, contains REC and HTH domains [Propionibacterium cyclohexanicum]|uniref:DNA-binding response regulator, NarL/FixJ family, contains REC and HTH domains n=1 Tax=Propionibacterium cyclohexanicum TaxID=64702 RepID=A0A1H9T5P5_9ACTN|nr:response regulator transcription factor [Propionibacterium cyclohexanicum]SER92466.1 DNA-binding response regulator, NarL/FixJ family, contains REC and HTH domains [Propionibacterium cyclohexanicum]
MDIHIPGLDGLEATRRLLDADAPDADGDVPRIVILTTFDLDRYVYAALQAGASGFLLKDVSADHLIAAVRTVQAGDALLAPTITRRLVERFARPRATATPTLRPSAFSLPGENEVLGHVARGMSNAEIAEALIVGETTVKSHVANLLGKLGLRNRAQTVVLACETGLVRAGDPPTL